MRGCAGSAYVVPDPTQETCPTDGADQNMGPTWQHELDHARSGIYLSALEELDDVNPFRTAVSFWGQLGTDLLGILIGLFPKRDWSSKRVKGHP